MSVENKKIVYFDYWTVGIGNFKFFDQKLKDKGFETKLIHLASWKGLKEPKHQTIQGIDSFDITYYKTNRIYDVLRKEKPAALIMLNASFITDRTLILSCRKLGIRSIYIMHGALVREEYIDENIKIQNQSLKRNRIGKAIKHLKGTVWNYVYTIWKFDKAYFFKKHIYDVLLGSFLNPAKYLNYPPPAFDLHPDLSLVYGELDKAFYEKKNLIQGSTIKIIGNPDLDKHFKELSTLEDNKEEFFRQSNIPTNKPYITYIDEGLVEDNFWDNEYRMDFFKTIIEICNQAGYRLVINYIQERREENMHLHFMN
ncbi:MAG: hypothetical protein IPI93_15255 [Sphingobacteriaceae bacterium]|nr:hypothetical protein [Sphingobacteriaceae bacterium]